MDERTSGEAAEMAYFFMTRQNRNPTMSSTIAQTMVIKRPING